MTQADINKAVFRASGKGFQRTKSLAAKYGAGAAFTAIAYAVANGRMRVYSKEAGGVGPSR